MVQYLFDVCMLRNDFKTCENQLEIEMWRILLQFIDDFSNDLKFINERHWLLIFIKEHTTDMSVFNDENILFDATKKSCPCQLLEEWDELAQFTDLSELLLEILPDVVRLHVV